MMLSPIRTSMPPLSAASVSASRATFFPVMRASFSESVARWASESGLQLRTLTRTTPCEASASRSKTSEISGRISIRFLSTRRSRKSTKVRRALPSRILWRSPFFAARGTRGEASTFRNPRSAR